ncbi:hypothetical protein OIU34_31260 [Pararhizobium sp. BT-229]|uniref:hypothetical protein n=1 Tax=Pararhizobium sp. BT-229 TaxID=2986923 RepID=UPI0021F7820C|nr:hypothetical protein [Pararhizobium sp. BT-229]MCV9966355.1 hypothetical protein [Pararhizobium sp. BT-229]
MIGASGKAWLNLEAGKHEKEAERFRFNNLERTARITDYQNRISAKRQTVAYIRSLVAGGTITNPVTRDGMTVEANTIEKMADDMDKFLVTEIPALAWHQSQAETYDVAAAALRAAAASHA